MSIGPDARERGAEDARLVAEVRAGRASAFDELVRCHQRRAVAAAYRLLGNKEDAADVAQDAFIRAYRGLGQLADPARFGGWLMRIVANLSLNFRRSRAVNPTVSFEQLGAATEGRGVADLLTGGSSRSGGGSQRASGAGIEAGELQAVIDGAMRTLPDAQRMALVLFSVEGWPQKEVAEALGCSVELVKWNVFQARKTLKETLARFLGTERNDDS